MPSQSKTHLENRAIAMKGNSNCVGRVLSEETKLKMREKALGRKMSAESIKKLSDSKRGKCLSESHKLKIGLGGLGKVHSEETKMKMSENMFNRYKNPELLKKMYPGNNRQANKIENELFQLLKDLFFNDYEYCGNFTFWINGKNPDFVLKSKNKVIELFGDYWHKNDDPEARESHFIENGYDAIVIWEKEVRLKTNRIHLINKLNSFHKGDL